MPTSNNHSLSLSSGWLEDHKLTGPHIMAFSSCITCVAFLALPVASLTGSSYHRHNLKPESLPLVSATASMRSTSQRQAEGIVSASGQPVRLGVATTTRWPAESLKFITVPVQVPSLHNAPARDRLRALQDSIFYAVSVNCVVASFRLYRHTTS
jgi:hypothetical protein